MLLRGRNTVGYTPYPTEVTDAFVAEAAAIGIDIFRIFDALNDVEQMRPAIEAVRATGTAVAEVALCYTGDLVDPAEKLYTLDYYLRLAEQIVDAGAHVWRSRTWPACCGRRRPRRWSPRCASASTCPSTCTPTTPPGGQLATLLAAIDAGVDAVDVASAPDGRHDEPAAAVGAGRGARRTPSATTGFDLRAVMDLEPYWEAVRRVYAPFESGLPAPTGRVYDHEIPGGQLSNLRQQAIALGLGEKFEQIEAMYAAADRILGRLVKVTPSLEGRRRPRAAPGRRRRGPGRVRRATPAGSTSPTR